jgi:hypothetical protein
VTVAALVAILTAQQAALPVPPLPDRCALVGAVLHAKAKKGLQGGERPTVVDVAFPEVDHIVRRTSASGRLVLEAEWKVGVRYRPVMAAEEACGDRTFVLEGEQPPNERGTTPLIVLVRLDRMPGRGPERFRFELRLSVSRHMPSPPGGGGYAVPPMKYIGVVERADTGGWTAKVKKATFAS